MERPVGKGFKGYHELFFHPDLMAKLKKKADKLGTTVEQLVEKNCLGCIQQSEGNMSEEKKGLTDEEKKMFELCHVDPGSWFTQTEVGFYAVLTDGKVTVPKEVIEKLKLEEDQLVVLKIDSA